MKRKVVNRKGLSHRVREKLDRNEVSINQLGIANDRLVEPVPNFLEAPCEKVFKGENNTFITMGRDRPSTLISGYGGKGHTGAGAIDIVVGRKSANVKTTDPITGEQLYVDNDFVEDASRIYVAQKTDIDTNFKLDTGTGPKSNGRAGIGIKSDNIRIVGRESLRLVTGTDLENSAGGQQISVPGIYLVAGNNFGGLQAIPLGGNLLECIESLTRHVDNLSAIVDSFLTYQTEYNAILMGHTHPDPLSMALGTAATGNPLQITNGSVLPSPEVVEAGIKATAAMTTITKADLVRQKTNLAGFRLKFLRPFGRKYINSRQNKVN